MAKITANSVRYYNKKFMPYAARCEKSKRYAIRCDNHTRFEVNGDWTCWAHMSDEARKLAPIERRRSA